MYSTLQEAYPSSNKQKATLSFDVMQNINPSTGKTDYYGFVKVGVNDIEVYQEKSFNNDIKITNDIRPFEMLPRKTKVMCGFEYEIYQSSKDEYDITNTNEFDYNNEYDIQGSFHSKTYDNDSKEDVYTGVICHTKLNTITFPIMNLNNDFCVVVKPMYKIVTSDYKFGSSPVQPQNDEIHYGERQHKIFYTSNILNRRDTLLNKQNITKKEPVKFEPFKERINKPVEDFIYYNQAKNISRTATYTDHVNVANDKLNNFNKDIDFVATCECDNQPKSYCINQNTSLNNEWDFQKPIVSFGNTGLCGYGIQNDSIDIVNRVIKQNRDVPPVFNDVYYVERGNKRLKTNRNEPEIEPVIYKPWFQQTKGYDMPIVNQFKVNNTETENNNNTDNNSESDSSELYEDDIEIIVSRPRIINSYDSKKPIVDETELHSDIKQAIDELMEYSF